MAKTHLVVRQAGATGAWKAARLTAGLGFVAVLGLLVWWPSLGLAVVWGAAIPLVAASLFLSPVLWRGVCPLASLNEFGNRFGSPAEPTPATRRALGLAGLVLFHVLVPARLVLFNHDAAAVTAAALGLGALAALLGARFRVRSAFCNALCPILPVERLYGQAPVLELDRGRCGACTLCTPSGCLDLSGPKNVAQILGPPRRSGGWLVEPFGLFAAALPGFIVGYFLAPSGPGSAFDVYLHTVAGAGLSAVIVGAAVLVADLRSAVVLPVLAGASGALYFYFTGPAMAALWGWPPILGRTLGTLVALLVAVWTIRALRLGRPVPAGLPG
ncbi:MAG: hypothetical protein AB7S39_20935 [Gemmatimonadales bacterium]